MPGGKHVIDGNGRELQPPMFLVDCDLVHSNLGLFFKFLWLIVCTRVCR